MKLKGFCTAKETINKMKRQQTRQDKIFANHISDRGLYTKYVKNSYNSYNPAKNKQSNLIMGRISEQTLFQRHTDGQWVHEQIIKSSGMETKTIMGQHFTCVRIAITKKLRNNKCWSSLVSQWVREFGIVTTVAQVVAVVQVRSLAFTIAASAAKKKEEEITNISKGVEEWECLCIVDRNANGNAVIIENSMELHPRINNRTIILSSNPTLSYLSVIWYFCLQSYFQEFILRKSLGMHIGCSSRQSSSMGNTENHIHFQKQKNGHTSYGTFIQRNSIIIKSTVVEEYVIWKNTHSGILSSL